MAAMRICMLISDKYKYIYYHNTHTNSLSTSYCYALYSLMLPPVWSNTSLSNYRHLQILQSKCLRVIGDYPRRTPISHLHSTLLLEPIYKFIYRLTENFFRNCSTHPNLLVCQIGNYTLSNLHTQYRKYIHKRTKHLLL